MLIPALDSQEMGMCEARMEYIVRRPSQQEKSKGKKEKGGGEEKRIQTKEKRKEKRSWPETHQGYIRPVSKLNTADKMDKDACCQA